MSIVGISICVEAYNIMTLSISYLFIINLYFYSNMDGIFMILSISRIQKTNSRKIARQYAHGCHILIIIL